MSASALADWQEQNREFLSIALDSLLAHLQGEDQPAAAGQLAALREQMSHMPAIDSLARAFALDPFERDLVLRCFAAEVDPRFRIDPRPLTVGSAMETLPGAHWSALDVSAPLRSWGIVELEGGTPLGEAQLRLAHDVVRLLLGFDPREEPNAPFAVLPDPPGLAAAQAEAAVALANAIVVTAEVTGQAPVVELHGSGAEDRLALASACADALEATLLTIDAAELPEPSGEQDDLLSSWARRGRATGSLLCITSTSTAAGEQRTLLERRLVSAVERVADPVFAAIEQASTREPARPLIRHATEALSVDGRCAVWKACVIETRRRLGSRRSRGLAQELELLASQFRIGGRTIERVCLEAEALARAHGEDAGQLDPLLLARWLREACVRAIDARLGPLAERVPLAGRAPVVLPEAPARLLEELAEQIRLAHRVDESWGMGQGVARAPVALFAGPSGTGKTHAAAALARDCGLALYRVDLSSVLSKYIGETESNLEQIFQAAGSGGAILLFDEADALFGMRSQVRDSHDRYANLGTSYLLQRIERTPTPVVLTSNLKDAIDPAFERRLHIIVEFPFPGEAERETIWRTVFPPSVPVGKLEPDRLARVAVTGATIANIARRGAFIAAGENSEVEMSHLLLSTERELRQSGRSLSPEELSAWR
jgi:hypothetical protein